MSDADWDAAIDLKQRIYDLATDVCAHLVAGGFVRAHEISVEVMLLERELALIGKAEAVAA